MFKTPAQSSSSRSGLSQARLAVAFAFPALALAGCYVVPVGPEGHYAHVVPGPVVVPPGPPHSVSPVVVHEGPGVVALPVRLYPANDLANQTGVLSGTVTNLMSGKGRFQFNYQGELLAGEATRVSGDERRGVASAYGPRGTYASCDYQMNTPLQGAGTCTFSNGAKYQVHIGS
jgi:hypothetical protein